MPVMTTDRWTHFVIRRVHAYGAAITRSRDAECRVTKLALIGGSRRRQLAAHVAADEAGAMLRHAELLVLRSVRAHSRAKGLLP